jgi:hypothetical protein
VVVHVFGARFALLREPLPLQMAAGEALPLEFEQGEGLTVPEKYGYASAEGSAQQIVPLDLEQNQVAVEPGSWRLVFLFPSDQDEGLYNVVDGPLVVIE